MASKEPKVLLAKVEVTPGVDPVPTGGANAILLMDDPKFKHNVLQVERNNAKGYFGRDQKLVYGKKLDLNFKVELAGSGAAGTIPPLAVLLKACGLGETILAAAVTGTAQAGAASTITLAAGASAVDNFYRYNTIRTTGGTGSGQTAVIKSYVGATKVATIYGAWTTPPDATTTYSIDAQVNYAPISPPTVFPTNTLYFYFSGKLHKLLYGRGSVKAMLAKGQKPYFEFDFQGVYGGITDAAFPAATLSGFQTPLVVNNANSGSFAVHGYAGILYNMAIDLANLVAYRNAPGVEDILLNDRAPTIDLTVEDPTIAQKDLPAIINANTLNAVGITHGTAAGNIVRIDCPLVQLLEPDYGDEDSQVTNTLKGELNPTYGSGNDEVIFTFK